MKKQNTMDILLEEEQWLEDKIAKLPLGYISEKHINGGTYHYLQRRVGNKIISIYIPNEQLNTMARKIKSRKCFERQLKSVKKEIAAIM